MIISVASGKGGTGKTTVSTGLAFSLGKNIQLLDCDVEEPNAHIFVKPDIYRTESVFIPVPVVDREKCNYCGKCQDVCAYNAIAAFSPKTKTGGNVLVFPELCHGCGACTYLCPQNCIKEVNRKVGVVELGEKDGIQFVHGRLNIGEAMAPPVIKAVKEKIDPGKIVVIDAPPGTSCPVISAIQGTDFSVLVTEPTPFGLNDLVLAVEVLRKMKIPFGVVINRSDLGDNKTEKYCKKEKIPILMKIPFSKEIAHAYSRGVPVPREFPEYTEKFQKLMEKIKTMI